MLHIGFPFSLISLSFVKNLRSSNSSIFDIALFSSAIRVKFGNWEMLFIDVIRLSWRKSSVIIEYDELTISISVIPFAVTRVHLVGLIFLKASDSFIWTFKCKNDFFFHLKLTSIWISKYKIESFTWDFFNLSFLGYTNLNKNFELLRVKCTLSCSQLLSI